MLPLCSAATLFLTWTCSFRVALIEAPPLPRSFFAAGTKPTADWTTNNSWNFRFLRINNERNFSLMSWNVSYVESWTRWVVQWINCQQISLSSNPGGKERQNRREFKVSWTQVVRRYEGSLSCSQLSVNRMSDLDLFLFFSAERGQLCEAQELAQGPVGTWSWNPRKQRPSGNMKGFAFFCGSQVLNPKTWIVHFVLIFLTSVSYFWKNGFSEKLKQNVGAPKSPLLKNRV